MILNYYHITYHVNLNQYYISMIFLLCVFITKKYFLITCINKNSFSFFLFLFIIRK